MKTGQSFAPTIWLYEKYIAKESRESVIAVQDATQSIILNLSGKLSHISKDTSHFGGTLDRCKAHLTDSVDVSNIGEVFSTVLKEAEKITASNKLMMENLESMEQEVSSLRGQMEELAEEAHKDQLTRVANRRAFDKRMEQALAEYEKSKTPFITIIIDIDHFKQFNDNYGHAMGDKVLTYVASSLKAGVGDKDMVARYGGEEFVILLPDADYKKGVTVANQIREKIASRKLTSGKVNETIGKVTISAGVSMMREEDNMLSLLERADKALYKAKHAGRNLVLGELDL